MLESYRPVSDARARYYADAAAVRHRFESEGVTLLIGDRTQRFKLPLDTHYDVYVRPAVRIDKYDERWDALLDKVEAFAERLAHGLRAK